MEAELKEMFNDLEALKRSSPESSLHNSIHQVPILNYLLLVIILLIDYFMELCFSGQCMIDLCFF